MKRCVVFAVETDKGDVAVVACQATGFDALKAMAVRAQDAGLAAVDGKRVPIVGGVVFSSVPFGPAFDFTCLTPKQREAAEEAAAKAKAKADEAERKRKEQEELDKAKALLDAEAKVRAAQSQGVQAGAQEPQAPAAGNGAAGNGAGGAAQGAQEGAQGPAEGGDEGEPKAPKGGKRK
jgi:hypothetical protein